MRSPPFLPFLRGGGGSNRTKNRTKNRGMPRLCHDMCVMTDVPSRGVSAVLTDVQSWPRATRGLSCAAAARGNRGATGRWTVSRSTTPVSHKAARGGHARPDGTVRYGTFQIFRSRPSTRGRARIRVARRSRDPTNVAPTADRQGPPRPLPVPTASNSSRAHDLSQHALHAQLWWLCLE